ncbi:MAG TPA: hypothetical protein VFS02_04455 [Telluria sp.]|nr:hypothetical protein [Telluria sp.]
MTLKRSLIHSPARHRRAVRLVAGARPIAQTPAYHQFADQSLMLGIPHGADVLSSLGFALVAACGLLCLWPMQGGRPSMRAATAIGCSWSACC